MSIKATNWVWGLALPPTPKLILMALADEADDDGNCWPSIKRIARKACVSDRTVRRTIKEYGSSGLLRVLPRTRNDGGQSSNRYTLALGEASLHRAQKCPHDNLSSPATTVSDGLTPLSGEPLSQSCQPALDTAVSGHDPLHDPSVRTTTTNGLTWDALPQFDTEKRIVVVNQLDGLAGDIRQDVLDELAGALRLNKINGPWPGWLRGLATNARAGKFELHHGLAVQAERARRKPSVPAARRNQLGLPPVDRVASPEVAKAAIAAINQTLVGRQDD